MKLLKASEMKDIDSRASSEYEIPSLILMENAGIKTVEVILNQLKITGGKNVTILAGKGNNGGDGLVIARQLINNGKNVDVFLLGKEQDLTPDAYTNFKILKKMTNRIYPLYENIHLDKLIDALFISDMIVDAIYGIGFKGSLGDFETGIVKKVNSCKSPVIAVDIPSGVEADTGKIHGEAVRASQTVTFALPKIGLILEPGKDYAGNVIVADISIPIELLQNEELKTNLITESIVKPFVRPRSPESHKGTYGHALIIGGSIGMTGAVVMSSQAALRSGAGLVTAGLPESLLSIADNNLIEVMTTPLAQTAQATIALEALPAIDNLLGTASACAIGPGMSRYPEANAILDFILKKSGIPLVIDADGLNALEGDISILRDRQVPIVLTPHPGEMAHLTGKSIDEIQANRIEVARDFATETGVILVLKGNKSIVATPAGEIFVNITGNPGMATAGSGDVLCGIITGLISQGLKPRDAAVIGVYIHGLAGDKASVAKGQRGLIAGDIIDCIPDILRQLENN